MTSASQLFQPLRLIVLAQRLYKLYSFHLHNEFKNISALTATKTMPNLLVWAHHKRRRLFIVKWTPGSEIHPSWSELNIVFYKINYIKFIFYFF